MLQVTCQIKLWLFINFQAVSDYGVKFEEWVLSADWKVYQVKRV